MSSFTELQLLHEKLLARQQTKVIRELRKQIVRHFSLDDLQLVAFNLGVNLDDLQGETNIVKVQEIIKWAERYGLIEQLVEILRRERPKVEWPLLQNLDVDEVEAYIQDVRQMSAIISSFSEREQLQAYLTYWARYVEEQTGTKPNDNLLPLQSPPFFSRIRASKWWIPTSLILILIFAIILMFLQGFDPSEDVTLTPSVETVLTVVSTSTLVIVPEEFTPTITNTPLPSATFTVTGTPSATPTQPTATASPTSTLNPVDCSNSAVIVPGIVAQLADEATFSFSGSSDAAIFECQGVYDRSNEMPPAVRIEYNEASNSFAFFGIGISEGFDASGFSEICAWVYTNESNQQFDLKLKDTNDVEFGIGITTNRTERWEEYCVELDGYPGIDLENIVVLTLSFNDAFGSVTIWVDDFEFK